MHFIKKSTKNHYRSCWGIPNIINIILYDDSHMYIIPLILAKGTVLLEKPNNIFDTHKDVRTHFCCLINCKSNSLAALLQHKRVMSVSNDYEFSALMVL